ncbi:MULTISPECIES: succinylglutamate desuccinylase/aspartoacylase domain-containing protein [Saliphagus]|uniref:Succinylglutamate desuccinylase/aspartoacylase family protein n=1 Tax=Saliphagus infecundisoli TaxID=1849069 RepID=A0ABD5QJK8_9EURY|nr:MULTISPECIES: succinylglutamate desuccinylase/aspartoacylase family protein [Saliphagus]
MTEADDTTDGRTDASNSRRSFLGRTAGVAVGAVAGLSAAGNAAAAGEACPTEEIETIDEDEEEEVERSEDEEEVETGSGHGHDRFTIMGGTPYETPVHVVDAPEAGPTAVVTGGVHGNEYAGMEAAREIAGWELQSGRLVVIPESNAVAAAQGTYVSPAGDLNQDFPTGREPTSAHARAIWGVITDYDADVVIDLHTSRGIYGAGGPSGVGQAIFPTPAGRPVASGVRNTVNAAHFEGTWAPSYAYTVGNTMTGIRPRLIHKVGGDLGVPGFLIEATRHGTDLDQRVEWLGANVAAILERTGFEL